MTSRRFDDLIWLLSRALALAVIAFLVVPISTTIVMSVDPRSTIGPLPPPGVSLRWFESFFSDDYYRRGLLTSLAVTGSAATISVIVGVTTAFVLDSQRFPGKQFVIAFLLSPLIVPSVVIGFGLLIFLSEQGLRNGFLRLVCGHVIITIPYTIRATLAGISGLDKNLVEAALSMGATDRRAFWDITFPLARTGIISGAIFACAVSMDDVAVSLMLTDAHTITLPVALISNIRANFDLTVAAAAVLLMLFTVVLVFALGKLVGLSRIIGQGMYR